MSSLEIEAKFVVEPPADLEKYRVAPELAGYSLGRLEQVVVVDDYLDTVDEDVHAGGYTLRNRHQSGQAYITLKSWKSQSDRYSVRQEYEFPVEEALQVQAWPVGEARALVGRMIGAKPLIRQFRICQTRGERALMARDQPVATLSLDEVEVQLDGEVIDRFDVLEVELLPQGDVTVLDQITASLQADGLTPTTVAKVRRAREAAARARSVRAGHSKRGGGPAPT